MTDVKKILSDESEKKGGEEEAKPENLFSRAVSGDKLGWSETRIKMSNVFEHFSFDLAMGVVIGFNIVVLIVEQNSASECGDKGKVWQGDRLIIVDDPCTDMPMSWPEWSNVALLVIYTIEIAVRLYVYHLKFFHNKLNCIDTFIVATGYIDLLGSTFSLAMLRIIRVARLARAHRLMVFVPELFFIIRGFASAMVTIFWGSLLTSVMLIIWAMLAVELVHPITRDINPEECPRCVEAFASVQIGVLTLFQTLVSGDSWGTVAVPIIEHNYAAFIVFGGTVFTYIGFANLIVAVVVDAAVESRDNDKQMQLNAKEAERLQVQKHLLTLCETMDSDASGSITLQELVEGYDEGGELYTTLHLMDIEREELVGLFHLFDYDGSGSLSYDEFVDNIYKIKTRDTRMTLIYIKYQMKLLLDEVGKGPRHSVVMTESQSAQQVPEAKSRDARPTNEGMSLSATNVVVKLVDIEKMEEKAVNKADILAKSIPSSSTEGNDMQKVAEWPAHDSGMEGLSRELSNLRRSLDDRLTAILEDNRRRSEEQAAISDRYGQAIEVLLGKVVAEEVAGEEGGPTNQVSGTVSKQQFCFASPRGLMCPGNTMTRKPNPPSTNITPPENPNAGLT